MSLDSWGVRFFEQPGDALIGDYEKVKLLGKGGFSSVFLARHKNGDFVALKMFSKSILKEKPVQMKRFKTELEILWQTRNDPQVCSILDVFETNLNYYVVLEYLDGGDLFDYVTSKPNGILEKEAAIIFKHICEAVNKLHQLNVIHHDLKPENVMLGNTFGGITHVTPVKLIDFGLSVTNVPTFSKIVEFSGTEAYSAPELLSRKPYQGRALDIYSLGVVLYIMLTGGYPFSDDVDDHFDEQTNDEYLDSLPYPDRVSITAKALVRRMLEKDENKRITMQDTLNHPFFDVVATTETTELNETSEEDWISFDEDSYYSMISDIDATFSEEELAASILRDMEED